MAIRARRREERPLPPAVWALLNDEEPPQDEESRAALIEMTYFTGSGVLSLSEWWEQYREEVLARWIQERPGTRPSCWWKWDAPRIPAGRWPGCYWDGNIVEPRRRTGGTGDLWSEMEDRGLPPKLEKGIPTDWVTQTQVDLYNGRPPYDGPRCVWSREWVEGHFPYTAYDPENPPTFESEAEYLDRHGLLTPAERDALGLWAT